MAFDVIAASYREREKEQSPLKRTITTSLLFGGIAVYIAAVGILAMFDERWILADRLTLGQIVLVLIALCAGLYVTHKTTARSMPAIMARAFAVGALTGGLLSLLVVVMSLFKLRFIFIALKPALFEMLTFGYGATAGVAMLIAGGALFSVLGGLLYIVPRAVRRPLVIGFMTAGFIGLFQDLIQLMLQYEGTVEAIRATIFTWDALKLEAAVAIVVVVAAGVALWMRIRDRVVGRFERLPTAQRVGIRMTGITLGALVLLLFPLVAGNFIGQVFMFVGLYVLMGMGLNLEVGLAGLLDLGFVAFFAVGAYTTALLTADSPHALAQLSYWQALPIVVLLSLVVGVLFGVPVLKIRGDYLAVATLGLGEIVRVLVLSDMAAPLLAGAQGVLNIPRPSIGTFELGNPVRLFYLTLVCAAVAGYFAWRLENSRLGRAWTAIRDDEDVAQALGINLINVKLLAYGLGAVFAGVAGSIFAVMLTSIFPHSFQLLISINVLALIIVGGMGSLPGVVVGAAALIGLPELLREFGEYRFLFYGVVIVTMMRIKPAGLWPSAARRREMGVDKDTDAAVTAGPGGAAPGRSAGEGGT
ncbi:MAG: branched-chain amino acid ABC transporter permease [Proteobacteria bacterium]|nr:branched-chain amino acid ABC transporter permease [Pseudomonadota bacterium]